MILKLDLSGDSHLALLSALQHDANFYMKHPLGANRPSRTPFVKIISDTVDKERPRWEDDPLLQRNVTLEVQETFWPEGEKESRDVPLAVLAHLFSAIEMYPGEPTVEKSKE